MPETKRIILLHKDKLELMKAIVKIQTIALHELYGIGGNFRDKLRYDVYKSLQKFSDKITRTKDEGCDCVVERETTETFTPQEALNFLSDGHGVVTPKEAWMICKAVDVPYDKHLEYHGFTQHESKGLFMAEGHEGDIIVDTGRLSNYVTSLFKLDAGSFIGRGFQAQANSKAIRKYLIEKGKIKEEDV